MFSAACREIQPPFDGMSPAPTGGPCEVMATAQPRWPWRAWCPIAHSTQAWRCSCRSRHGWMPSKVPWHSSGERETLYWEALSRRMWRRSPKRKSHEQKPGTFYKKKSLKKSLMRSSMSAQGAQDSRLSPQAKPAQLPYPRAAELCSELPLTIDFQPQAKV